MSWHKIKLPWPPTVNTYWRHNRGRFHVSQKGQAYRDAVTILCMVAKLSNLKLEGDLSRFIEAYPPDRKRRDLDNILKAPLDALQYAGVYYDDFQFNQITVVRMGVVADGKLKVKILQETDNGTN